jgi:hypothetical protein
MEVSGGGAAAQAPPTVTTVDAARSRIAGQRNKADGEKVRDFTWEGTPLGVVDFR